MGEAPISHRSPEFVDRLERCRRILCKLTGAANVQVFVGSGTAANDTVAAQLALRGEIGLVLHAGEFGHRLCDHARRAGLEFHEAQARWGSDHDFVTARRLLEEHPEIRWIWSVHCETSTGRLHDLDPLRRLAESHHADLVLDCISSVGAVPIDLSGIAFATAVSGKALASFAGLAMVFHSRPIGSDSRLPRSLDLGAHAQSPTVPFTQSSNLVGALEAALSRFQSGGRCTVEPRWQATRELAASIHDALERRGLTPLTPLAASSPAVTTVELPQGTASLELGDALARRGLHLSYRSEYLRHRNLIQICLMGEHHRSEIEAFFETLDLLSERAPAS